ncbi:MAG TPA: IS21 family transposase [Thermomicrobiales bacterium]|nr:IS21 family transposase [Thermomicrobiales bacterium]
MQRSAIHLLAKRGKSIRQIGAELGYSPTTVSRVLKEPVDQQPAKRHRRSKVDPYREQILGWLDQGLTATRMVELAREDADRPYSGGSAVFRAMVRRLRLEREQEQAAADVPIRFEGLPGEYLQVDWGEVRNLPFSQQPAATRYFLCCRLKYSRWSFVRWTRDMRQETLLRALVECFLALRWVPWVLVFDNMKTVTSGRDAANQPLWTPALAQFAAEFGCHPQACDPGAGNQKGSVEALVKWVKGSFLPGRTFADDADLAAQAQAWTERANARPSAATDAPPLERLAAEAATGGALPATAADWGRLESGRVTTESVVHVEGNQYSVPTAHVGASVSVRLHRERVRVWRDAVLLADHPRAPAGAHQRVIDPTHFASVLAEKPRAKAMVYRQALLDLGEEAYRYVAELSRRRRERLADEVLGVYALFERYGRAELCAAMALAAEAGVYGADYLGLVLAAPGQAAAPAALPVPTQAEVDRLLSSYEAFVGREPAGWAVSA